MTVTEIYTLKEFLDKLETEFYHLHDWFGKYDRIIWTFRSLLFTITAAVIVHSFQSNLSNARLFISVMLFSIFFLGMEIYWIFAYWKKRTLRYKEIQKVVNEHLATNFIGIPLLNMDKSLPAAENDGTQSEQLCMSRKVFEPVMFYSGLILISGLLFL